MTDICKCGIAREVCDYHRPESTSVDAQSGWLARAGSFVSSYMAKFHPDVTWSYCTKPSLGVMIVTIGSHSVELPKMQLRDVAAELDAICP